MKIRYEFVTGEFSEIEVDDSLGELLVDFDRQQYNNDHKETRRHVSLDGMEYEGELFASVADTADEVERREELARLTGGEQITQTMLEGAEELLSAADAYKKTLA